MDSEGSAAIVSLHLLMVSGIVWRYVGESLIFLPRSTSSMIPDLTSSSA